MRKLFSVFFLSIFFISVNAQLIPGVIASSIQTSAYCAEYQLVYNAMTTKPSAANATLQNAMVKSLVDDGWWVRIAEMWVFAQDANTAGEANISWKNVGTHTAVPSAGLAWTTLQGYRGDATEDDMTLPWNPTDDGGVIFTQNSASVCVYQRISGTYTLTSSRSGIPFTFLDFLPNGNTTDAKINTDGSMTSWDPTVDGTGFYIMTRTAAAVQSTYRNGTLLVTDTDASGLMPDIDIILFHRGASFGSSQVSVVILMDKIINATEAAALTTIIETFMDGLGTGIIP